MAARIWTIAQRRAQMEAIRSWSPWTKSTGPRTKAGKLIAARNALKSGVHSKTVRVFNAVMRRHAKLCVTLRLLAKSGVSENELLALWAVPPVPHPCCTCETGLSPPLLS